MKNVIITGASSGIGATLSKKLSTTGHKITLVGRDIEKLDGVKKSCSTDCETYSVDLTDIDKTMSFCQSWLAAHPSVEGENKLEAIILNAGSIERNDFIKTPLSEWDLQYKMSVASPITVVQQFWDRIIKDKTKIISISSTLGIKPIRGTSAYSALKAAMINWTQSLAEEMAAYGVTVNAVCPGIIETPIHNQVDETWRASVSELVPMGRPGLPEDICNYVNFLISPEANWITGTAHIVDGGLLSLK